MDVELNSFAHVQEYYKQGYYVTPGTDQRLSAPGCGCVGCVAIHCRRENIPHEFVSTSGLPEPDLSKHPKVKRKVTVDKDEYDWLEWFYLNADFGPADFDVRRCLRERYESEGGVWPYPEED